jgi:hypothetical protein
MPDYRNSNDPFYRDPNNPLSPNTGYEPAAGGNSGWGWIAGAVFLVVILALAFGLGHEPSRVASNDIAPPRTNHIAPPTSPGLTPPPAMAPPAAPGLAPPPPAQSGQ